MQAVYTGSYQAINHAIRLNFSNLNYNIMKKGNLPTQEYELINVCMQTVENGTPLTCDDCGRTILILLR